MAQSGVGSLSCSTASPTCRHAWPSRRRGPSATCGFPAGAGPSRPTSSRPGGPGGRGGPRHYSLSVSTSDQMIAHQFRGELDRAAIIEEMTAAVAVAGEAGLRDAGGVPGGYSVGVDARTGRGTTTGICSSSRSRPGTPARHGRYSGTIGGDFPGRVREQFTDLASAVGIPVKTHATTTWAWPWPIRVGSLGDLNAGQDAWINACMNGIGDERATPACCPLLVSGTGSGSARSSGRRRRGPLDPAWARGSVCQRRTRRGGAAAASPGSAATRSRTSRHPRRRGAEGPGEPCALRRRALGPLPPTGARARAGWC